MRDKSIVDSTATHKNRTPERQYTTSSDYTWHIRQHCIVAMAHCGTKTDLYLTFIGNCCRLLFRCCRQDRARSERNNQHCDLCQHEKTTLDVKDNDYTYIVLHLTGQISNLASVCSSFCIYTHTRSCALWGINLLTHILVIDFWHSTYWDYVVGTTKFETVQIETHCVELLELCLFRLQRWTKMLQISLPCIFKFYTTHWRHNSIYFTRHSVW